MKFRKLKRLEPLFAMLLCGTLASCGSLTALSGLGTQTPQTDSSTAADSIPFACSEFALIRPNLGKPGGTTPEEVTAQLGRPDASLDHARNYLGDTKSTLEQIAEHNASFKAICGEKSELH